MGVIRTDSWLLEDYENPINMCEKLEEYFPDADALEIYQYLMSYGMYRVALPEGKNQINQWKKMNLWERVEQEVQELQKQWSGPDIPVFIFPSDSENPFLKTEQNGKSGLAFSDKLFLFIGEEHDWNEIRALVIHEYNHVCRLSYKREDEYVLLDSVILEGLAELAVLERLGKAYLAKWGTYYSDRELQKIWGKYINPNKELTRDHPKHYDVLFGKKGYPKMAGYCVGSYLVKKYSEKYNGSVKDLLPLPSTRIAML